MPAVGTRFARRIEPRNFGDRRAEFECRPFEDGDELRKPEVAHLASPHLLHRLHVQIFDGDVRVFEAYLAGELEVVVFAAIRDVLTDKRRVGLNDRHGSLLPLVAFAGRLLM